jgi:hypothetical protein
MSWIGLLLVIGLTIGLGCSCCRACRPHDGELALQATVTGLDAIRCAGCETLASLPLTLHEHAPAALSDHCDWPASEGPACRWFGEAAVPCDPIDCDTCGCSYECFGGCASDGDCAASCNASVGGCDDCRFVHGCDVSVSGMLWLQTCVCDNPPEGTCLCEPCADWLTVACNDDVGISASVNIYRVAGSAHVRVAASVETSWIDGSTGRVRGIVEVEAAQIDCGELDITIPLADDCEFPWTASEATFRCAAPTSLRVQAV